jgi:hypothetical protein
VKLATKRSPPFIGLPFLSPRCLPPYDKVDIPMKAKSQHFAETIKSDLKEPLSMPTPSGQSELE